MKRGLRWIAWYLSIGVALGISEGAHQTRRFDPGFSPAFAAAVTLIAWPWVLAWDLQALIAHSSGPPRR
ncbi:MAG: hypothetical protein ACHQ52_05500 [Candidatus Eisenbacteria bacterium]